MQRRDAAIGLVLMCNAGAIAAQSPGGSQTAAPKDDVVVVTGCVAQSPDGQYMLDDAIMAAPRGGKAASAAVAPGIPADKAVLSYVLDGGSVKAHVGHKVEIT